METRSELPQDWLVGTVRPASNPLFPILVLIAILAILWIAKREGVISSVVIPTTPRFRPRLRFSLRMLFVLMTVVAVGLGYIGWQWRIVQERKALWDLLGSRIFDDATGTEPFHVTFHDASGTSWLRRWLGDWTFHHSGQSNLTPEECRRVAEAFPGATIRLVTLEKPIPTLDDCLPASASALALNLKPSPRLLDYR